MLFGYRCKVVHVFRYRTTAYMLIEQTKRDNFLTSWKTFRLMFQCGALLWILCPCSLDEASFHHSTGAGRGWCKPLLKGDRPFNFPVSVSGVVAWPSAFWLIQYLFSQDQKKWLQKNQNRSHPSTSASCAACIRLKDWKKGRLMFKQGAMSSSEWRQAELILLVPSTEICELIGKQSQQEIEI